MISQTRLLLSSLILCSALVACSDSDNNTAEATNTVTTISDTATQKIEAGMSEQAVTALLGEPTISQTHKLDTLTITHSEWTNESGTTSVQFQNGKVQFNQFTATTK